MRTKPTPGPFRLDGYGRHRLAIFSATQQTPIVTIYCDPRTREVNDANAAFVLGAMNALPDRVRAAELEAGISYALDLLRDGLVEEAMLELDRRLPGADGKTAKDQQ